jgi:hypothetical protein
MTLYRYTRRCGNYADGETVWYHPTIAEPLLRTGLIVLAERPAVQREVVVETAVAREAPERAVTRRGRWGKR